MRRINLTKEYTLVLSDFIKEKDEEVVELFNKHLAGCAFFDILAPVYLDGKGCIFYHGGGFTCHEKLPYPEGSAELLRNQLPKPREVDFSPLWAFVIKNKVLRRLKLPKEFGRNIYTHADFCVRVRKLGFKFFVHPNIKVTYKQAFGLQKAKSAFERELKKSRDKFLNLHGDWLDSLYRLPVMFHTHSGYPGGYCMHARHILKALVRKKVQIYYKFVGGCNDDEPLSNDFLIDDLRNDMGSHRLPQVVLSTGLNCFSNSGDYKIGYTTTEVDGIPDDWVRVLNEMDEVWATSEFAKKAFINSNVRKPIFVMPEGIDPDYFHPKITPFENNTKRKFVFFSNFAWGRRKGVDILFEAFSKEFSYKEDVILVIKALPSYFKEDIQKHIRDLYYDPKAAPIVVWDTILDPYLLGGLYTAGHCFVFPSRGEGFGLPPLEALACGTPVVTTGYSAPMEYLVRKGKVLGGVELLDYKIEKFDGTDSIYYFGHNWARPSVSSLRRAMRRVYKNWDRYKAGAMESSEYVRKEWTWDKAADKIIERLEQLKGLDNTKLDLSFKLKPKNYAEVR